MPKRPKTEAAEKKQHKEIVEPNTPSVANKINEELCQAIRSVGCTGVINTDVVFSAKSIRFKYSFTIPLDKKQ